ncbi:MAG: exodeoxyribonuclease VIII [Parvibaculaceae bacterium]|nr:exodeoxyribonuclease VIII [Parvibaculaceae bacterium]
MSDNLLYWNQFSDIDPRMTKAITGKGYSGTSPSPQYVIQCLTKMFGPAGKGFGWEVITESFEPLGAETLHWCRIKFWWRDEEGPHSIESYGQTRAAYKTAKGKNLVDEDAPKKSLTDAIVKAASYVGVAANIFLGRWDDNKYVHSLALRYEAEERLPEIEKAIEGATTMDALGRHWRDNQELIRSLSDAEREALTRAKDDRKDAISQASRMAAE